MINIAVLGCGTVGSGVVDVFFKNKESLERKAGQELDLKYILDVRDFPDSLYACRLYTSCPSSAPAPSSSRGGSC